MDKTTQSETIKAYRIRDWHKHFENNRTRDMKKMAWVPVPNKHDGEGFQRIMREKDGMVIYGCWHLILQVASKCLRERGTLLREDGTPLDAEAIAYKTGWRSAGDIQRSLDFLCNPQIGWIEQVAQDGQIIPHLPAEIPHLPARNGMEGKGTEKKSIAPDKPTIVDDSDFESFWAAYPRKVAKKAAFKAFKAAKDKPDIQTLLGAIAKQRDTDAWKKDGGQFIPHPATWINAGRWDDVTIINHSGELVDTGKRQKEREIAEYADRIKALRSWHGDSKCPFGDPVEEERRLSRKILDTHGKEFLDAVYRNVKATK